MSVDKNLFPYNLAVAAIVKDEGRYLKEWLDYHLAAGVDHFFLYDNGSTDDTREVLKPYIDARLADYIFVPGELMQIPAYSDAARRFRFSCRYLAFLDLDEFIFPKTGQSIVEVVDEVLEDSPNAAGLAINWQVFGSNNLETADYSKGVLERFTRRAPSDWFEPVTDKTLPAGNIHVKTIANPRFIYRIVNPHYVYYFSGKFAVNSNGERVKRWSNEPVLTDKIVVHHYFTKSREEFQNKIQRGRSGVDWKDFEFATLNMTNFDKNDRNEVFDEDILTYRQLRMEDYTPPKTFSREDFFKTLEGILLTASRQDTPEDFFVGKLETFLTCRTVAGALRNAFPNDKRGRFMEEAALRAINRTHFTELSFAEIMLMLSSLPQILRLPYPVVADIHKNCMGFARQIMDDYRRSAQWENFTDMGSYMELLGAFGSRLKP